MSQFFFLHFLTILRWPHHLAAAAGIVVVLCTAFSCGTVKRFPFVRGEMNDFLHFVRQEYHLIFSIAKSPFATAHTHTNTHAHKEEYMQRHTNTIRL